MSGGRKGFTAVGMLVVGVLVAVFVTVAFPRLAHRVVEQRRIALVMKRFSAVKEAEAMYYSLNGAYTMSFAALAVEVPEVDDELVGSSDGQWEYSIMTTRGANPSFSVTAVRANGKGIVGSVVWDSSVGAWSGTHPLRPG